MDDGLKIAAMFLTTIAVAVFVVNVWDALRKPKKKKKGGHVSVHSLVDGTEKPLSETPQGKLGAKIAKGVCPDCGGKGGFYEGPSGGMSTNIYCMNPKCRAFFNFTPMFGEAHAERMGKAPSWFKYPGEEKNGPSGTQTDDRPN